MEGKAMLKTLSAAALGLVLFAAPSFAAHDQADAKKAVETFAENYAKAFNAKDVTAIVAMFASDGVEAGPGPILTNRDDIEKRFKAIFAMGGSDLHFDIKQAQAEGNIVFAVGTFTVKLNGNTIGGNITNVYEWDGDALKYRVHGYNFTPPPAQR
jgi:ketosteroid isomerase-like protein